MSPTPRRFHLSLVIAAGVLCALALVAAGCGGSSPSSASSAIDTTAAASSNGSSKSFAECLKENGIEGFDPGSNPQGGPPQNFDRAALQKAMQACGSLRPQGQGFGGPGQNGQSSAQRRRAPVVPEEARHRELPARCHTEQRRSAKASERAAGMRCLETRRSASGSRQQRPGGHGVVRGVRAVYEEPGCCSARLRVGNADRHGIREVQAGAEGMPVASQREHPVSGAENRGRLWFNLLLVVAVAAGAVGAYVVLGSDTSSASKASRTTSASKGVVLSTVSASGNVKAAEQLNVNFQNSGVLTSITVQAGQKVTRGQTLATQDSANAESQVKTAKANLASAQARLAQLEAGLTPQEQQQNQVAVQQASQQVASAKNGLASTNSVAKQDTGGATLTLQQAKQQQKADAAQLAADQKKLSAANASVASAQKAYDAAAAATASNKTALATAQAAQQAAQLKQTDDNGAAQLHQQQQSQNQTALSNANSALQTAKQNESSACTPDPLSLACADAKSATISAQSAADTAQATVNAGQAQAIADQQTANDNAEGGRRCEHRGLERAERVHRQFDCRADRQVDAANGTEHSGLTRDGGHERQDQSGVGLEAGRERTAESRLDEFTQCAIQGERPAVPHDSTTQQTVNRRSKCRKR